MTNNSKRLARQRQLRNRTIMVAVVTALIAVIIIVMAVKKGNLRKEDKGNHSDNAVQSSSNIDGKASKDNQEDEKNSSNVTSENSSEENPKSEEGTTEDTNCTDS